VLLHELAHVRQRDARGQQLFSLALVVLYFHPLYWWLRRVAGLSRELLADHWAAGHSSPAVYAEQLISLLRARGPQVPPPVGALGLFSSTTQFYRRMKMLIERDQPLATSVSTTWRWGWTIGLAVVVCAGAALFGARRTAAQQTGAPPSSNEQAAGQPAPPAATPAARQPESESARALRAELKLLRDRLQELEGIAPKAAAEQGQPHAADYLREAMRQQEIAEQGAVVQELEQRMSEFRKNLAAMRFQVSDLARTRRENLPDDARRNFEESISEHEKRLTELRQQLIEARAKFLRAGDPTQTQAPAATPTAALQPRPSTSQLDLIDLADRYGKAVAEVKVAQLELTELKDLGVREPKAVSTQRVAIAQVHLQAAEKKVLLLRQIIESAMEGAKAELDHATQLQDMAKSRYATGLVPAEEVMGTERAVRQAKANLDILKLILSQ
jgi:hypothetical protein